MKSLILASVFLVLAFLVLFDQYSNFGTWWDMRQFLHHENIAAVIAAVGVGILIGSKMKSRKDATY